MNRGKAKRERKLAAWLERKLDWRSAEQRRIRTRPIVLHPEQVVDLLGRAYPR